jgi:toxin ParE1/3/4
MAEVIWTQIAKEDLQDIYDYISLDSEVYALRVIDKIVERTEILSKHPMTGREVPEFGQKEIREVIEGNYRIVYYLEDADKIQIIRVHHGARLLK